MIDTWMLSLAPVIIGALVQPLFEGLQKALTLLEKLPAWAKQIAVAAIALAITKGAALLGVTFNIVDAAQLTQQDLAALAAAGFAYVFHGNVTLSKVAK